MIICFFIELILDIFGFDTFSKFIFISVFGFFIVYSSFINIVLIYELQTPTWYLCAF